MKRVRKGILAAASLLVLGAAPAQADFITFTADAPGFKPNGYMSPESGLVSFTDSVGEGLAVFDFTPQSFGQGLAVFTDFDNSELIMNFSVLVDALSMGFGNDDPGFSSPGDEAVLKAFLGATLLGEVRVVMNRNDIMDQVIGISGVGAFDKATLKYDVVPTQGLIEVVDNINFRQAPEPATMALFGVGLLGMAAARRRRKTS